VVRTAAGDATLVAPPGPVPVRGERLALERAVGNLVANARRHGEGEVTVTVAESGGRATVTVADEGPGLEPDEAAHAFERFWRGPRAREAGSGLGLAIVRAVAERHGGAARVSGSAFTIELPAVKELSSSAGTTLV
jgi:signal transduction histidine kinase